MEERLKNLKKSMKTTCFSQLEFTEDDRNQIHKKIEKEVEDDEMILLAVLQLLLEEKTGHDVAKQLRSRGILKFEDEEGLLYTVLHALEQKNYLIVRWRSDYSKMYKLTSKGRKVLKKMETKRVRGVLKLSNLTGNYEL